MAALRNPQSKDAVGSQGVLKFSAVVLGPGDAQKVHDPAKEDDEEVDLGENTSHCFNSFNAL